MLQHAEHYSRILTAAQATHAPVRRDEDQDDESETETAREPARERSASGMAVMDAEEEADAQPETLDSDQRASAPAVKSGGDDGDAAPSRTRRRRVPRRTKSADDAAEDRREETPSGLEVVEPSDRSEPGSTASAEVGGGDGGWSEPERGSVAGAAFN